MEKSKGEMWKKRQENFKVLLLALKLEGLKISQGMLVASRSWDWPLTDIQQGRKTSVLQLQGTKLSTT